MNTKLVLYGIIVICYFVAGTMDLFATELKRGLLAILYGTANAIIFLWR